MRKHGNPREKGANCANGNLEIGGAEATLVARHIGQSERSIGAWAAPGKKDCVRSGISHKN